LHINSKSSQPRSAIDGASETIGDPLRQDFLQQQPARVERQGPQIGAVEPHDIERDIGWRARAAHKVHENRPATFVGGDDLAVDYRVVDREHGRDLAGERVEAGEDIVVAESDGCGAARCSRGPGSRHISR